MKNRVRINMQAHKKKAREDMRKYKEELEHMRNDQGFKELEENTKDIQATTKVNHILVDLSSTVLNIKTSHVCQNVILSTI